MMGRCEDCKFCKIIEPPKQEFISKKRDVQPPPTPPTQYLCCYNPPTILGGVVGMDPVSGPVWAARPFFANVSAEMCCGKFERGLPGIDRTMNN